MQLILSLFPGIGLLDMAFEEEGFCVVRGPDLLWGGDIHRFHPPAGKFDGVIGGPPCQAFSRLRHLNPTCGARTRNLIPEFERVVANAAPGWFLMENVSDAPTPSVSGYVTRSVLVDNLRVNGDSARRRRFSFGTADGRALPVEVEAFYSEPKALAVTSSANTVPVKIGGSGKIKSTVLAGHSPIGRNDAGYKLRLTIEDACELQGLPRDYFGDSPLTSHGKRAALGNGVPLPMGRAVARAVKEATKRCAAE